MMKMTLNVIIADVNCRFIHKVAADENWKSLTGNFGYLTQIESLWKVLKTRVLRVPRAGCLT